MFRKTNVLHGHVARATNSSMRDDEIQCTAELMCWPRAVQYQSVAVHQQVQLIGVVVVVAIEPDVYITDDINRLLEDGDSIDACGQLIKGLLRRGDQSWTVDDNHGGGELTDNGSKT